MAIDKKQLTKILHYALSVKLSDAERGEIYAKFAQLYLQTINELNKEYEKVLDDAIMILKDMDSKEKELAQKLAIAKAKAELK